MKINNKFKILTIIILSALLSCSFGLYAFAAESFENTSGTFNNIVVLVSFADDSSYVSGNYVNAFEDLYNKSGTDAVSAKNYFSEISMGKLNFSGVFVGETSTFAAVQLDENRAYYLPEYYNGGTATNFSGAYDNSFYLNGQKVDEDTENAKSILTEALEKI